MDDETRKRLREDMENQIVALLQTTLIDNPTKFGLLYCWDLGLRPHTVRVLSEPIVREERESLLAYLRDCIKRRPE